MVISPYRFGSAFGFLWNIDVQIRKMIRLYKKNLKNSLKLLIYLLMGGKAFEKRIVQ